MKRFLHKFIKTQKKPNTTVDEKAVIENVKKIEKKDKLEPFKIQIVARSRWGKSVIAMEKLRQLVKDKLIKPHRIFLFS